MYYTILKPSRTLQNIFLFIASLFFYAWGEPKFVFVMMLSIVMNWMFGILVDKYRDTRASKLIIVGDLFVNLGIIFIFKYLILQI